MNEVLLQEIIEGSTKCKAYRGIKRLHNAE